MTEERISLSIEDGVGRITLSAPGRRNAVDLAFCREFAKAATRCASDPALDLIVLESSGDIFSVGGDIDEFIAHEANIEHHVLDMSLTYHVGITALARAPAPVLVAAAGMIAGGAVSLLAIADIVLLSDTAKICAAFTRSGLTPDGGATFTLTRQLGYQRAFEILATNPVISAEEAVRIGMAARHVPADRLAAERDALIETLRHMPKGTLASLKQLMRGAMQASLEEQLAREAQSIARSAARPATIARLKEFLGKSGR